MKKMKMVALLLVVMITCAACGGNETEKENADAVNGVVENTEKDVVEEMTAGETIKREDYSSIEDYLMAKTIAEIGDYSAPLWEARLTDGTVRREHEGFDYTTGMKVDNIKYIVNETTKEAICTWYDQKAFQDAGIDTLTIPAEVNGYKVIAIDGVEVGYREGGNFFKKIVIEDGVRQIHDSFKSSDVLEEVVIPDSVVLITQNSLNNCKNLKSITLPKNLMWLDGLGFSAITSVEIPENVRYLNGLYNSEVAEVTFAGEKLEAVSEQSFSECPNLSTLQLPDSVR